MEQEQLQSLYDHFKGCPLFALNSAKTSNFVLNLSFLASLISVFSKQFLENHLKRTLLACIHLKKSSPLLTYFLCEALPFETYPEILLNKL